jgi:pilus assembly protein CpaC
MFRLSTILSGGKVFLAIGVLVLFAGMPLLVHAEKGSLENVRNDAPSGAPVYITLGKAELISVDGDVADVLVANPSIIDVTAIQSNRLYVVGLGVGDTNLIALNAQGDIVKRVDIHVKYDLQAIQDVVNDLFPDENAKVGAVHDQIFLTGSASTPEKASKIVNVVGHYVSDLQDSDKPIDEQISNLLEVRGEQQVMLQVKIVEASRNVIKELGVETSLNDPDELSATTIFGGLPSSSASRSIDSVAVGSGIALSQDPLGVGRLLFDSGLEGIGAVGLFLNALEEENLIHILAEPNLTAVSGEQAGFLAGGEFPVPVGRDQTGNIVIEFKQFGVSLNFRPVVLSDKRISLQMNTEVSSLDFSNTLAIAEIPVPGLDVRRAETTVEVASGASLMIAGLLQSEAVKGMKGLPGISKTPVLGDLVKSDSFQRDETELVVIVTPYLVNPYAEKDRAQPVQKAQSNPLAKIFAQNIRGTFDIKDEDELFAHEENFGYLLN